MNFKCFIFDLDATLAATNQLIFDSFNFITSKYLGFTFTPNELISKFGPTEEVLIKELFSEHDIEKVCNDYYNFYESNHQQYVKLYDGIIDILEFLKSKNKLITIFTGKGDKTTHISLKSLKIENYFNLVVTGDSVNKPKPDPEGIILTINKFNLFKDEVIMIGDSVHDILASKSAEIKIASALWDSYSSNEIPKYLPDFTFQKPDDLLDWLKSNIEWSY